MRQADAEGAQASGEVVVLVRSAAGLRGWSPLARPDGQASQASREVASLPRTHASSRPTRYHPPTQLD